MINSFNKAITFLFSIEKYRADTPGDSGGLTIWGISSHWYPEIVNTLKTMSMDASQVYAKNWYYNYYWEPEGCDDLAYPLDCYVFIEAVNTEGANCHHIRDLAKGASDPSAFLRIMNTHYKEIVKSHPNELKFLKGWEDRLSQIKETFV